MGLIQPSGEQKIRVLAANCVAKFVRFRISPWTAASRSGVGNVSHAQRVIMCVPSMQCVMEM